MARAAGADLTGGGPPGQLFGGGGGYGAGGRGGVSAENTAENKKGKFTKTLLTLSVNSYILKPSKGGKRNECNRLHKSFHRWSMC